MGEAEEDGVDVHSAPVAGPETTRSSLPAVSVESVSTLESIHHLSQQPFIFEVPPRSSAATSASQPLPSTPSSRASSLRTAPAPTAQSKGDQSINIRRRSDNFWHLDGSVDIQVQNKLFRLHRSRLAQQSEYFAALFRRSNGSKTSPVLVEHDFVDSCPVYVVRGVSVLDFERLLAALDSGISGQGISMASLKQNMSMHRTPQRPSSLHCDLPEPLKCAYYHLIRTPDFGQDLAAYVHAESSGVNSTTSSRLKSETGEDEENAPRARLPASDLLCLVSAKEALQKEWLELLRAPPLSSAFPCQPSQIPMETRGAQVKEAARRCADARKLEEKRWMSRLIRNKVFELGMVDIFAGMQQLINTEWKGKGFCVGCATERRDAWSARRERLWDRLDVLLGLKGEDEH
ncbi:hypothetical protein BD414DRAFT_577903 [Trametes punicea]|nr:hypothetical protein BD414DRAFT_577903 [Trametes punicea]